MIRDALGFATRPDSGTQPTWRWWAPWLIAVLATAALTANGADADELWVIRSGHTHIALNVDLLRDLGIDVQVTGEIEAGDPDIHLERPWWSFEVLPGSDLTFRAEHGVVLPRGGTGGTLRLAGTIVLRDRATGKETRLDGLEIAHRAAKGPVPPGTRGADPLLLRSAVSKLVFCELRNSMFDFRHSPSLAVHYLNARITESWARAIGRPELAGWIVGMGEVRAEAERLSVTAPSGPAPASVITGTFLDVSLGQLFDIQQVGHAGLFPNGRAGLAMATTSCNVGNVDVPWLGPMQENHPLIHMALYRLRDDRFEQIGVSWLKHGFFALSNSDCTPCQHPSPGTFLGVGCSDTYDVFNNSDREFLGPRGEVNAYTGHWTCLGSHFAGGFPDCIRRHFESGHGPIDHRLDVADADLNNPGATYYYEACYVVQGDQKLNNNWGYRRCTMSWNGSAWFFQTPLPGNPLVTGQALAAWGGSSNIIDVAPGDGQVRLSVKATPLGGATYHYEYALMNLNSDRQIRSFSLPIRGVANVTNLGYHDNDANAGNDWQVTIDGDAITWQTETHAQNPNANALVFGHLVNFRFDADAAPSPLEVTLGLFKPGPGQQVVAATTGPTNLVTGVGDAVPAARLIEVRPNPFSRSATITYQAALGPVELSIYDPAGRLVRRLVRHDEGNDVRSVEWNGDGEGGARVRAGVYYARLTAGTVTPVKPVVLAD